jgi:DNA-binding transcriptional LysR family regulator
MRGPVRLPSIDGLRAFEAAARHGNFERAGDELGITASAVSKRVAALEELIGTPLFARTPKALALTATGVEYLAQIAGALEALAALPLHQRASQRSERLRISSPPTFARQILVPRLPEFVEAHPQVEIEVVLSIPYLGAAVEADVEVRLGHEGGEPLMIERVLPLAAPALISRLGGLRRPADLLGAPLLRTPIEPWAPWFAAAGLSRDEPQLGPKLVDLGLTLEAAVAGQGVALGRPSLARPWLESGALVAPLRIDALPAGQYRVTAGPGTVPIAFASWLRDRCEDAARAGRESLSRRA